MAKRGCKVGEDAYLVYEGTKEEADFDSQARQAGDEAAAKVKGGKAKAKGGKAKAKEAAKSKAVEMTGEQLDAYLTYALKNHHADAITRAQQVLTNTYLFDSIKQDEKAELDELSDTETEATLATLKEEIEHVVNEMKNAGVSEDVIMNTVVPELSEHATLGELSGIATAAADRMTVARERGEAKEGQKFASNAYTITINANGKMQKVIFRVAQGKATMANMHEELSEIAALVWEQEQQDRNLTQLGAELQAFQQEVLKANPESKQFIKTEGELTRQAVLEAMSSLSVLKTIMDAAQGGTQVSQSVAKMAAYHLKYVDAFNGAARVATMMNDYLNKGKLSEKVEELINTMGSSIEAAYARNIRTKAEEQQRLALDLEEQEVKAKADLAPINIEELKARVKASTAEPSDTESNNNFSLAPELNNEILSIEADEIITDKKELRTLLLSQRGNYTNKKTGLVASLSRDSADKLTHATGESVANLTRLGYSPEEAAQIHYTVAAKTTKLYETAELYFQEEDYHRQEERKSVYHFFEPVAMSTSQGQKTFLANVSVIELINKNDGSRLFSLELTIENPINVNAAVLPYTGTSNKRVNEISELRLSAFNSFVNKEKNNIAKKARLQGLIPWVVDEQAIAELESEKIKEPNGKWEERFDKSTHTRSPHQAQSDNIKIEEEVKGNFSIDSNEQLLAPNGKPSNLTPDQWHQVRTPQFLKWFGDWINDPANASKVVDENGEPLVVYHGTGTKIEEFDPKLTGLGNDQYGSGFYFSSDKQQAEYYTTATLDDRSKLGGSDNPNVLSVYLNIRNPLMLGADIQHLGEVNVSKANAAKIIALAPNIFNTDESPLVDFMDNRGKPFTKANIKEAVAVCGWDLRTLEGDFFSGDSTAYRHAVNKILGYDGIIKQFSDGTSHYVAWFPNQIKSVENKGGWSTGDNRINFSLDGYTEELLKTPQEIYGSINPTREEVKKVWERVLNHCCYSDLSNAELSTFYPVCPTPAVLRMIGVPSKMMTIIPPRIKKVMSGKHLVTYADLLTLTDQLSDPVAIFNSLTYPNSIVILTTMMDETKVGMRPAMAAIHMSKSITSEGIEIHEISSIYGRTSSHAYEQEPPLYVNRNFLKEDGGSWLQLPNTTIRLKGSSTRNIPNEDDLVNYKKEKNIHFSIVNEHAAEQAREIFSPLLESDSRARALVRVIGKRMTLWNTIISQLDKPEQAARVFGELNTLLAEAMRILPASERFKIRAYQKLAAVLTNALESGKVSNFRQLKTAEFRKLKAEFTQALDELGVNQEQAERKAQIKQLEQELINAQAEEENAKQLRNSQEWEDNKQPTPESVQLHEDYLTAKEETRAIKAKLKELKQQSKIKPLVEDLTRSIAEGKLFTLLQSILKDTRSHLETQIKKNMEERVFGIAAKMLPKKGKNGKLVKGNTNADDMRHLQLILAMADATQEQVEDEQQRILGMIEKLDGDDKGQDALKIYTFGESRIKTNREGLEYIFNHWALFGDLQAKDLAQSTTAMKELLDFMHNSRATWQQKKEIEKKQIKTVANDLISGMNKRRAKKGLAPLSSQAVKDTKSAFGRGMGLIKGQPSEFRTFAQIAGLLTSIPEVAPFFKGAIADIARANVELGKRENRDTAAITQMIANALGVKTDRKGKKQISKWLNESKKNRATGATVHHKESKTINTTYADAIDWLLMSEEEAEAKRQQIEEQAKAQGIAPHMLGYVAAHEVRYLRATLEERISNRQGGVLVSNAMLLDYLDQRKDQGKLDITIEIEGALEELRLSKEQAMYQILLWEQDRYKHNFELDGYTPETIEQLYSYVGEEGLAIAYALRDYVHANGLELAEVYERQMGVPFPAEENYFVARFNNADNGTSEGTIEGAGQTSNARYRSLIMRQKHNAKPDLTVGVFSATLASLAEQNNYICVSETTGKLRSLIAIPSARDAMLVHMGKDNFDKLKQWLDVIDNAGVGDAQALSNTSRWVNALNSARAHVWLSYKTMTLYKQLSAILNPILAGDINTLQLLGAYAKMIAGQGHFSLKQIHAQDAISVRTKTNPILRQMMEMPQDAILPFLQKFASGGLIVLEHVDAIVNTVAYTAYANQQYEQLSRANEEAARNGEPTSTQEELEARALDNMLQALDKGAQPLRKVQRSAKSVMGGWAGRLMTFMGGDTIMKFSNIADALKHGQYLKALNVYASFSIAEQTMLALIVLSQGDAPDNDEEWEEFFITQGIASFGTLLGEVPLIGNTIDYTVSKLGGGKYYTNYGSEIIPLSDLATNIEKLSSGKVKTKTQKHRLYLQTIDQLAIIFAPVLLTSASRPAIQVGSALLALSVADNPVSTWTKQILQEVFDEGKRRSFK